MSPFRPTSEPRTQGARQPTAAAGVEELGLFSPNEVQQLMRVEFDRAQRYHYSLSCLLVGVDRLERLHDVHGVDTKRDILGVIARLVKEEIRESDLLACAIDDQLLVIIPHTPPEGAEILARRVLAAARRLQFYADGREVHITLSIGGAFNKPEAKLYYDALTQVAQSSLDVARQAGGDRYVHSELYDHFQKKLEREEEPAPAQPSQVPSEDAVAVAAALSSPTLADLRRLLELGLIASENGSRALEPDERADLEARLEIEGRLRSIEEERDELLGKRNDEHRREKENLERRINKLAALLSKTEAELARIASLKDSDEGVASVYQDVQGLDSEDQAVALKRDLMHKIFQANLDLKQALNPPKS